MVLGIRPNRAETGYGYIETGGLFQGDALHVRRFTEKPNAERAAEFVAAGSYFWNSGMFLWSAQTLVEALQRTSAQDRVGAGKNRGDLRNAQICCHFQAAVSGV